MASQVHPVGVRPLMFKRSVNYVKIAVHKEPTLDGNIYTVLFLGTGEFYSWNDINRLKAAMNWSCWHGFPDITFSFYCAEHKV